MPTLIDPAELAELNLRFLAGLDEKGIVGPEDLLAVANLIGPWAVMQAAVCIGQKDGRISFDEGLILYLVNLKVSNLNFLQIAFKSTSLSFGLSGYIISTGDLGFNGFRNKSLLYQ